MSITINSNILSLNAQRRLGQHTNDLRSSFEKLSSGLRVSKASDDAAGLAISENLKTDSKLSSQALRNVNDGISMISIISGTLDAQKSILFRMAELAEQSANGTNSQKQRKSLQQEYTSLQEEFDRVASSAKFNGISLLRNPDPKTISVMAGITGSDASLLSVAAANSHRFSGEVALTSNVNGDTGVSASDLIQLFQFISNTEQISSGSQLTSSSILNIKDSNGQEVKIKLVLSRIRNDFLIVGETAGATPALLDVYGTAVGSTGELGTFSSIGNDSLSSTANELVVSGTMNSTGASFSTTLDLSGISYTSYENPNDVERPSNIGFTTIVDQNTAKHALVTVKNRIEDLSKLQGSFGAIESRLTFAANKLQVDRENFQSAASQITDVDVATESSKLTKKQILQQAAVSVLAQANQQPQIALQLLSGLK